jgi:hypothetical protein
MVQRCTYIRLSFSSSTAVTLEPIYLGCQLRGLVATSHCGGPGSIPGRDVAFEEKVPFGLVFSEYINFPYQFTFHQPLHIH